MTFYRSSVFAVLTILVMTNFIKGQVLTEEPFKKANVIVVKTDTTADAAFMQWGRHLATHGFSIDESNKDFMTLKTGALSTSKLNVLFYVNSNITEDGSVNIRLKLKVNTPLSDYSDWDYRGMKGSPMMVVYEDMMKIISEFKGSVFYAHL